MRNLFIVLLLCISVIACKKADNGPKVLTVAVSKIASGTTYTVTVKNQSNTVLIYQSNKTANTSYTATVASGDDLICSYSITTPGTTVGEGDVVFSINGDTRWSVGNGSGTYTFKVF